MTFLWLPLAAHRYVTATGDTGVLDESINFIEGRLLKPDEEAYYDLPTRSEESGTFTTTASEQSGIVCGLASTACPSWALVTGTIA